LNISEQSIQALGRVISGDPIAKEKDAITPYQSGSELVSFFNELGGDDNYGQGFPSRWFYVEEKIKEVNGDRKLQEVIIKAFDPRRFLGTDFIQQKACDYLNEYLEFDGLSVQLLGKTPRVCGIANGLVVSVDMFTGSKEERHMFIQEQLEKIQNKLDAADYDGAITNARSMLEAVLTSLEVEMDKDASSYDGDLPRLYKRVNMLLGLDPNREDLNQPMKQILSGLVSVIAGLSGLSNKTGDRHVRVYKPDKRHAALVVDSAKTVANFIFETWASNYEANHPDASESR